MQARKLLDGITKRGGLQAMREAQAYANTVGFRYTSVEEVLAAVKQEHAELLIAHAAGERAVIEEEIGDNLFALLRLCQWLEIDPERLLRANTVKYLRRVVAMEDWLTSQGQTWDDVDDWRTIWREAKRGYRSNAPTEE